MYNTHIVMPDVPWSTVPGPRSKGFDRDKEADALKIHGQFVSQMERFGLANAFVVTDFAGEEVKRTQINGGILP